MTKARYIIEYELINKKENCFCYVNRSVSTDNMTNKMNDCVQVNLRITTNSNQGKIFI